MGTQYDEKVNTLILSSLRMVNGYSDGDLPDTEAMENARIALNNIIDELEVDGQRIFKKEWRTKVFRASSVITGTDGKTYRCVKTHTTPDTTDWVTATEIPVDVIVRPTVANGFYYINTQLGVSGAVEPAWPAEKDLVISDGGLVWKAVEDTSPVTGVLQSEYWIEDSSLEATAEHGDNVRYSCAGDFNLADDEAGLVKAYFTKAGSKFTVPIVREDVYINDSSSKLTGSPEYIYVEANGSTNIAHIRPIPNEVGTDGLLLRYEAVIRSENYGVGETDSFDFPDNWMRALKYLLAVDLSFEYSLEDRQVYALNARAKEALKTAKKQDKPLETSRFISSSY